MIIRQNGFTITLPPRLPSLCVFYGQEVFLVEQFKQALKQAWISARKQTIDAVDYHRVDIIQSADWQVLAGHLGNYSLFTSITVIEGIYDKKTIEKDGKLFLNDYLERADSDSLLILYCPQLTATTVKFLSDDPRALVCPVKIPPPAIIARWITDELGRHFTSIPATIPRLIEQYTQGNLLACSQTIQKITIAEDPTTPLTEAIVRAHLQNQCNFQLYDLSDACLTGDVEKALSIFRYAIDNRFEPILILWILAQEIRLLIQLHDLMSPSRRLSFQTASNKLKIWSSRSNFYQAALKRLSSATLIPLLSQCQQLDTMIKSSQNNQLLNQFELIICTLCLGKGMNPVE